VLEGGLLKRVLHMLPRQSGEAAATAMRLIAWRAAAIKDLYISMKGLQLFTALPRTDTEVQLLILQALNVVAAELTTANLLELLPMLRDTFRQHRDDRCRLQYYSLAAAAYDREAAAAAGGGGGGTSTEPEQVRQLGLAVLREGLADESAQVRESILEQWSKPEMLARSPDQRLLRLLDTLYHSSAESEFLPTAAYTVLNLCSGCSRFDEPLFDSPLEECTFTEMAGKEY
jgi:hypothetical protein